MRGRHCHRGTRRAPRLKPGHAYAAAVGDANDINEFLTSRRARITPEQVGLPSYGKRRVPGLRREEVASLAGVSIEYYRRLERGGVAGVSEAVLEALARALQLDDAERAHLFDLARAARTARIAPFATRQEARPPSLTAPPPADRGTRNHQQRPRRLPHCEQARARPVRPSIESREQPPNSARFTFLDPAARDFYPDWDRIRLRVVAALRSHAGRDPYDRALQDLIGELSTRSSDFRVRWAAHDVRFHRSGSKRLHHPIVGELELSYETMTLDAHDGLRLALFTAEPGTTSQDALALLASWTATPELIDQPAPGEPRAS